MNNNKTQNCRCLENLDVSNRRVSKQSNWYDEKWLFDDGPAGYTQSKKTINWAVDLPDGSKLTDKQNEQLLEAARQFIWSLKTDPPKGVSSKKIGSLIKFSYSLFTLIKWMINNNYSSFSEVNSTATERYRDYIRQTCKSRASNEKLSNSTSHYYQTVIYLYKQRDKLINAIQEEPFNGQTAHKLAKESATSAGWIPYIPDEVALASLSHTLEWFEWRASDIIQLLQIHLSKSFVDIHGQRRYSKEYDQAITEFQFSTPPGASAPWREKLKSSAELRTLVDDLIGACINGLAGFVGMRRHEIAGLESECVEIYPSMDGLLEVFYIVGRTSKVGELPARWAAGARLAGTNDIPPPIRAIEIVKAIFLPWRDQPKNTSLFLNFHGGKRGFSDTSKQLNMMSVDVINKRLADFNQKYVPLPKEWHFTSHQWRKTFARFVAITNKNALAALSQHFLHISIAMTDRGYIGNDFELEELIDEIVRAETADILIQVLLLGRSVAGRMGEQLMEKHTALIAHFRGMTIKDAEEEIKWIVEDSGMSIHSCEWGWCMYRQESSQCEGSQKGPDHAKRGPSVCAGCSNLMVEEKHIPWWQDRLDKNLALLTQLNNAGASGLQKAPVQARVRECQHVINMFNLSREKLNAKTQ